MTDSIRTLSMTASEYIRAHSEMYLPPGGLPLAAKLVGLLVADSLALRVQDVHITRSGEWCAVSADCDWLGLGKNTSAVHELFRNALPLPEAGVNSIRHEVVVAAFSRDVLTSLNGEVVVIANDGDESALAIGIDLCESRAPCRAVAFRSRTDPSGDVP